MGGPDGFAWASPTYIRDHLTEVQLFGYEQNLPKVRERRNKALAGEIVNDIIRRIMPAFCKVKPK
jgi:hypothetical protein